MVVGLGMVAWMCLCEVDMDCAWEVGWELETGLCSFGMGG